MAGRGRGSPDAKRAVTPFLDLSKPVATTVAGTQGQGARVTTKVSLRSKACFAVRPALDHNPGVEKSFP